MEVLDFPVVINDGKTGCEENSLRWTSEIDHCFIRVLMQHMILGNKGMLDDKFNPLVYDAATLNLGEMFALELTKDQVEDRFKSWKKRVWFVKGPVGPR
ncbi:Myb/SANT-like DNA-binding domain protein [Cucumis melo var. makuwa]|uniref:Myb/SANT-like DNA-binding domain protein n=1 Tax=Cucumis melo var. makuwa TaxID=1194695 RepID=A0A5D3DY37_CUCMM|nr:Myb/SANT-like DNA-binding domain protein [Cucumis melo var. makuwa]